MQCPNCGKEAVNINGREICLDCGIEIAHNVPVEEEAQTEPMMMPANEQAAYSASEVDDQVFTDTMAQEDDNSVEPIIATQQTQDEVANDVSPRISLDNVPENIEPTVQQASIAVDQAGQGIQMDPQNIPINTTIENIPEQNPTDVPEKAEPVNPVEDNLTQDQGFAPVSISEQKEVPTVQDEGEKIAVTVAEKKEEAPKVNLINPQSDNFENVESKPVSELVPEEPVMLLQDEKPLPSTDSLDIPTPQAPLSEMKQPEIATISQPLSTPVDTIGFGNDQFVTQSSSSILGPPVTTGMDIMPAQGIVNKRSIKRIAAAVIIIAVIAILAFAGLALKNKYLTPSENTASSQSLKSF